MKFSTFLLLGLAVIVITIPFSLPFSEEIWVPNSEQLIEVKIERSEYFNEFIYNDPEFNRVSYEEIQEMEIKEIWIGKVGTVAYLTADNDFFVTSEYHRSGADLTIEQTEEKIILHHGMTWNYILLAIIGWLIGFLLLIFTGSPSNRQQQQQQQG